MINSVTALENFKNKEYDNLLKDIYVDDSVLDYQRLRYIQAIMQYETLFCQDNISIFSAPGRSEVCGNHTDHQHGKVLATSINLDTIGIAAKNNSNIVRVVSNGYDMITIDVNDLDLKKLGEYSQTFFRIAGQEQISKTALGQYRFSFRCRNQRRFFHQQDQHK